MDDDELITRLAAGDDTALRELFVRHAPWLATRLRAELSAGEVEDVVQETFLAVWRGARRYRPEGAAGAWLWGIARRQAALLRRRSRSASGAPALAADEAPSVEDPQASVLERTELEEAVASLGPDGSPDREVWRLLYEEDRPLAEVAWLMGVPVGTVKSRAYRVRRRLRAALDEAATEKGAP